MTIDMRDETIEAFHSAVSILTSFAPRNKLPLGPNFGVAVAVLLHRNNPTRFVIPSAGAATSTRDLQLKVCDPTWEKAREFWLPGATGPIYKPFTMSFKGRSPHVNNWRNSFDIQGGIGCNAPFSPAYLQSPDFIAEHRFDCTYRDTTSGYCHAAGSGALCFNPRKKGGGVPAWSDTSADHRPKLLRRGRDSEGAYGYWSIEPTIESLSDLLGDPEVRVPAEAFATALFAGSPYWSQWSSDYSAARLQHLLALDDEHFFTLFSGPQAIVGSAASAPDSKTQSAAGPASERSAALANASSPFVSGRHERPMPVDYVSQDTSVVIQLASSEPDPERRRRLLEKATQGHRRVLNVLAARLTQAGYEVKEQPGGFDLYASDGESRHVLFEAKTWTPANLASQVRSGWAQLEEYAYRNRFIVGDSPELALVLNHEPPKNFWAWEWFEARKAPHVLWLDGNELSTFSESSDWLDGLLAG